MDLISIRPLGRKLLLLYLIVKLINRDVFSRMTLESYLGVGVLLKEALQLPEADLAVLLAGAAELEDGLQLRLVRHRRHPRSA